MGQLDYFAFPVPDTTMDGLDPAELWRLRDIFSRNRNGNQTPLEFPDEEVLERAIPTVVTSAS